MNPVASCPQQSRLRRALEREDLLTVALDLFPTDTTALADYVLPAASFLEFDDLIASYFNLTLSAQVKVMPPIGQALPNLEIFRRLARAMGFSEPELYESDAQILDTLLARSGLGEDFASLAAKGSLWIPQQPAVQFADRTFATPSGRIEIASSQAAADGPAAAAAVLERSASCGRQAAAAESGARLAAQYELRECQSNSHAAGGGDHCAAPLGCRGAAGDATAIACWFTTIAAASN